MENDLEETEMKRSVTKNNSQRIFKDLNMVNLNKHIQSWTCGAHLKKVFTYPYPEIVQNKYF